MPPVAEVLESVSTGPLGKSPSQGIFFKILEEKVIKLE